MPKIELAFILVSPTGKYAWDGRGIVALNPGTLASLPTWPGKKEALDASARLAKTVVKGLVPMKVSAIV